MIVYLFSNFYGIITIYLEEEERKKNNNYNNQKLK